MTSDLLTDSPWAEHSNSEPGASRAEADRLQHEAERLRAIRVVAAASISTDDARDLIAMLGLTMTEAQAARRLSSAAA